MKKDRKEHSRPEPSSTQLRLNKYISHAGIASRRKAGELVKSGKVKVNGEVERNPAIVVGSKDVVEFNGEVVKPRVEQHYILLNKPKNTISTTDDERGRMTVIELVDKENELGLFTVGRLDRDTTGLLLLTNDGDLSQKLTHPSFKVGKVYHVILDKEIGEEQLEQIQKGVELEEGIAVVDALNYIIDRPKNEVAIELHIGWNRIIRRIFQKMGFEVKKLDRVYFAGLTKKGLGRGRYRKLTREEVIRLKSFREL